MNTPIKDQGKKFLLFLYHAPTQDRSSDRSESSSSNKGSAGASSSDKGGSLKDKRKKEQLEGEKGGAKGGGKGSSELLDLNDRVRSTFLGTRARHTHAHVYERLT